MERCYVQILIKMGVARETLAWLSKCLSKYLPHVRMPLAAPPLHTCMLPQPTYLVLLTTYLEDMRFKFLPAWCVPFNSQMPSGVRCQLK